jgi:hypothetical protein
MSTSDEHRPLEIETMNNQRDPELIDQEASTIPDDDTCVGLVESEGAEPGCETPPTESSQWTGPTCEKCAAPLKCDAVTICGKCGWYANLGTFVEIDSQWEADEHQPTQAQQQPSHLQVWLHLLPAWAWIVIASVTAVVVESIAVRVLTPAEIGGLRTRWALAQLGIGAFAFVGCHILNFLIRVSDDTDVGMLDVLLKPIKLWMRTARDLPARLWLINTAACGLAAAVLAIVVIGALPYERLWDWGFKAPPKPNLMGAVIDRAKQLDNGGGADNLEDAISDFAGSQDLEPGGLPKALPDKARAKTDCVILGYQQDRDGRLYMLILGTVNRGELVYGGKVKPELSDDEAADLLEKLLAIKTHEPFVPVPGLSATWVEPDYACRVSYSEKSKSGRLQEVKWESMLGALNGP